MQAAGAYVTGGYGIVQWMELIGETPHFSVTLWAVHSSCFIGICLTGSENLEKITVILDRKCWRLLPWGLSYVLSDIPLLLGQEREGNKKEGGKAE